MTFNSEFEKYAVKHRGISSNTLHTYASHLVTGLTPNIIEERPNECCCDGCLQPFDDGPYYFSWISDK
jgi:hypothetical protein